MFEKKNYRKRTKKITKLLTQKRQIIQETEGNFLLHDHVYRFKRPSMSIK